MKGRNRVERFLTCGKKRADKILSSYGSWPSFVLLSLCAAKKIPLSDGHADAGIFHAIAFFIGELRERGLTTLPSTLRALWRVHTVQIPLGALALIGLSLYSAVKLGTSPWLLVFIIPSALLFYFSIRRRRNVGQIAVMTVILMSLLPFVIGLNARDYITRGQGGLYELASALQVAEDTCDQSLYTFRNDIEIVWITGRKNIPVGIDTVIEELPALVLIDERDEKSFREWTASKRLTFYEIYKFRHKENYRIYRIKKARS